MGADRQAALTGLGEDEVTAVLSDVGIATFRWRAETDHLQWSGNAGTVLGLRDGILPATGRGFTRLLGGHGLPQRSRILPAIDGAAAAETWGSSYRVVYAIRPEVRSDGQEANVEEIGKVLFHENGTVLGTEGVLRILASAAEVPGASGLDPLTGLRRRDSLIADLDGVIRTLTQDGQGSAAFMIVAVDDLSRLNLNFGYEVGNHIIHAVIDRIACRMRQGDVLGHMSGHKFGVILKNCSESALLVAADRFRTAVSDTMVVACGTAVQAGISMGAVLVPRYAQDAMTAALRAEEALADLRTARRTGLQVYAPSPERDQIRRQNVTRADQIAWGLENDRFVLAYQPVVEAKTRRIRCYEALSRLVLADGLVISAGSLIETAERLGLVQRIDMRTLALALHDLAENPDLCLAVNASAETLTDSVWFERLVEAVRADRSIAPRLTVEITETAVMSDLTQMLRVCQSLRDIGCRIAIDDFGVGQTSFKALRSLEVDWLKIDGSYIRDITTNPDSLAFARGLQGLAEHFGIRTVAEWVGDETSAELLAGLGIHALQGEVAGAPLLRVTRLTESILTGPDCPPPRQVPGSFTFAGLSVGPLSTTGKAPSPAEAA